MHLRFLIPTIAILLGAQGCKKSGNGTNIAQYDTCNTGPDSHCAAGLYCKETGPETMHGDTLYATGICVPGEPPPARFTAPFGTAPLMMTGGTATASPKRR